MGGVAATLEASWVGREEMVSEQVFFFFFQQLSEKQSEGEGGPRESQDPQDAAGKDLGKYLILLLLQVMTMCEILVCADPGSRELTP